MKALIVIDPQNDFCPGGALAVAGGDEIMPQINAMMSDFDLVVLTQDWHPAGHSSFASSHGGADPFTVTDMPYGPQVLWPDHCIQASPGADFHPALNTTRADAIIRKGMNLAVDSYSAFFENDKYRHRSCRLPERAWLHQPDHGRAGHRLLRRLVGARRRRAGVQGQCDACLMPRHRP